MLGVTTLPQPTDCCNPCAGARTACVVECSDSGAGNATWVVNTTIDARALPATVADRDIVIKLGDITAGDGNGITYYFDVNSSAADNGASVLAITAKPIGRLLQYI